MSDCKYRRKDGVCLQDLEYVYKGYCVDGPCSCFEPQTNADRIRAMGDEELADEYIRIFHQLGLYTDSWAWLRKWLKAPVEEVDE